MDAAVNIFPRIFGLTLSRRQRGIVGKVAVQRKPELRNVYEDLVKANLSLEIDK